MLPPSGFYLSEVERPHVETLLVGLNHTWVLGHHICTSLWGEHASGTWAPQLWKRAAGGVKREVGQVEGGKDCGGGHQEVEDISGGMGKLGSVQG